MGAVKPFPPITEKILSLTQHEIYIVHDKDLTFEYANHAALANLGYSLQELNALRLSDLFNFPDEMAIQALLKSLRDPETDFLKLQLKLIRKNGNSYDAEALIRVLEKDRLFLLMITPITDKLETEKKLRETILEKETLIKEIHHRVKNNLQLISSIIYLKIDSLNDSDIRSFLEDTRQKIRSIALIHERLLQTENLDKVELSDYLGKLIHDLQITYFREDLELEIKTSIARRMTGIDTAIICGLIVNELVTNAIKHAFNNGTGRIEITYDYDETDQHSLLVISDNGVSIPEHVSPGSTSSFGMQLVDIFVKQLGGTVNIIREKGTKFIIRF